VCVCVCVMCARPIANNINIIDTIGENGQTASHIEETVKPSLLSAPPPTPKSPRPFLSLMLVASLLPRRSPGPHLVCQSTVLLLCRCWEAGGVLLPVCCYYSVQIWEGALERSHWASKIACKLPDALADEWAGRGHCQRQLWSWGKPIPRLAGRLP